MFACGQTLDLYTSVGKRSFIYCVKVVKPLLDVVWYKSNRWYYFSVIHLPTFETVRKSEATSLFSDAGSHSVLISGFWPKMVWCIHRLLRRQSEWPTSVARIYSGCCELYSRHTFLMVLTTIGLTCNSRPPFWNRPVGRKSYSTAKMHDGNLICCNRLEPLRISDGSWCKHRVFFYTMCSAIRR